MAARSVNVALDSNAAFLNLRRTEVKLEDGVFTTLPPLLIGNRGEWASESNGFATGTEGRVTYQIETVDGERIGEVRLHWNNPFVGSNSYHESVTPAAADPTDTNFSVVHTGGKGENASVRFLLLTGFCTANSETDEISCSTADKLTTTNDRYAAIFEQTPGPSFHAMHRVTSQRYQQMFDQLVGQGFRPTAVSGYSTGNETRFASIYEQHEGPPFAAHHNLTSDQYQQKFDQLVGQGFRPIAISGYSIG
jgi:hypothetical protein